MFDISQNVNDYLNLIVTHECNKKCPFCVDQYRGENLMVSLEHVKKSLDLAKDKNIKDVLLIGGEPTLHPHIIEIAKLTKSYGFRVIMTTNYSKPDVVKALDGIVDCFNISYYSQPVLPHQKDFVSDITIHTIIHRKQLNTKVKLDNFINKYNDYGHLKFSTLTDCNDWTSKMHLVEYLNDLEGKRVVLFNEIEGLIYRGKVIKRHDVIVNETAGQSIKVHVTGEISHSWERSKITVKNIT